MPQGSVRITFPKNRLVYINGNFTPDFPKKIPCTFAVEFGENVFETLNGDDEVDYRAEVTTDASHLSQKVALTAVSDADP